MIAARGSAQNYSMHASYTRSEYLRLHTVFEGEVVGQVTTLVLSAEEEERVRVTDLEGPKVE